MKHQTINRSLNDACSRLSREVREHPLLTIGVAVGVGAVLGAWAGQATVTPRTRPHFLRELADGFSDQARHAGDRARRTGRLLNKEWHATANRATEALPEVPIDQLVRRGRKWLTKLV